ncbi:MAG: CpsD/CapB family tyrosine-protein kinase, partial [Candidatus Cloacimonetes bacterium]|nr:CpsD/CapB family tyrosine-protein kinase [Candidatus Cloacimonadota bacterium]
MIHNIFNIDKENGITDYLTDKSTQLSSFIKRSNIKNLDIITSGHIPPNPSELLSSKRMDDAIAYLKEKYDYVLLDAPPIIAVTDSMILAKKVDKMFISVRVGKADKKVIKRTKELLDNIDVDITGVIINGVHPQKYYSSYEYNYYYYYYYGNENDKSKNKKSRKN